MFTGQHRPAGAARPATPPVRERGVVLFIALIVLVAMSLAGIGMMRSVDTSNVIAGNLAFKQSTLQGADAGVEAAFQWLVARSGSPQLNFTDAAAGYYSARPGSEDWTNPASWTDAKCINACNPDANTGNRVWYVIHRMCTEADTAYNGMGATGAQNECALYFTEGTSAPGGSKAIGAVTFKGNPQIYYRVTARVQGPRNTFSVVQTTVLVEN